VACGECGDNDDERPQAPERKHQAQQKQEVIDAFEDVPKARHHEAQCCLMPARIKRDRPGIAVKLECPRCTVRCQEAKRRRDGMGEPVDAHADGEF
jgi:hypothetical protein